MKRHMKPFLLIIFTLLSLSAIAQENYKDGYIVLANRDTVRGAIDSREWVNNPSRISFRDKTGKVISYTPPEIGSFSVNEEIYRSFTIRIYPFSLDPVVTASENWNATPYDSTVFLRLLTGGRLNLYQYEDQRDLIYFFAQTPGAVPQELRIRSQVVETDGHQGVSTDLLYRDQLTGLLADCGTVVRRAGQAAYSEKALRKLVFAYNNCGKDTIEQRAAPTGTTGKGVAFIPMLGYLHSSVRISGEVDEAHMSWPAYNTFAAGMGMQILLPRAREQFSFFTDLLYAHFSSAGGGFTVNSFTTENSVIDFNQLKLDIQFRYRYPEGSVRPFLNAGFSNTMIISNKSYQNDYNSFDNSNTHGPIFGTSGGMKSFQVGIIGGGGITAGRWSVEARFERLPGISDFQSIGSPMTNYYLLAGFRL
ncbi:MAG TPA: hypothetical protein VGM30_21595 [Puia sp.]|jgi:hypothetical protein